MRILLSCLFFLGGCGYRWNYEFPNEVRPVIAVPYIHGDEDGALTAEIISRLVSSGIAKVCASKGDFRLQLVIISDCENQIGYRRDPQKIKQNIQKNLLAAELRKTMNVELTLFHGDTENIALGPYKISAWIDFDYVDGDSFQDLTFPGGVAGAPIPVLPFSLGQLEEVGSARLAATNPLYCKLAQKIVDVISREW